MIVRNSSKFLAFLLLGALVMVFFLFIHPHLQKDDFHNKLAKRKDLVRTLRLTDLCIFTEARYTRHLSQADLQSPFQDYPTAFDHFPSGSLVRPPGHLLEKR